jgi:CubicO group peptidase (beta-lactamase class C family)
MSGYHIPGVAACAIKNGNVDWMEAYGYANIEQNITVTTDTLFMLGSVSKIVTGIAFMQLYENNLIDLDDDINDYLPFQIIHPDYPANVITPRMLLSHVSGIHDNWNILGPLEVSGSDTPLSLEVFIQGYLLSGGIYYHSNNFIDAEPGSAYEYTNVGSTLVAYLVEVISNTTFEEYCQQNIFLPLGMNETSWFLSNLNSDHIAIPYYYTSSGFDTYGHYSSAVYPCGFLRTSISQHARLMTALMEGGIFADSKILDNSTLQLMMTHHYPDLASHYGFFFEHYGVLWGHNGAGPGVSTRLFFYPEAHEGVIVMLNIEDSSALNDIHNHILECMRNTNGWLT